MEVVIRKATIEDLEPVLEVLDDCAGWLQSIGVREQWPPSFSASQESVAAIATRLGDGLIYMSRDPASSHVAAVFRLEDGDRRNQDLWPVDGPSLYLGSLAVRRTFAGKGIGTTVLQWAYEQARSAGMTLRLDCWAGNDKLRNYYAAAGFEPVGDVLTTEIAGRSYGVARFERR